MNDKKTLPNAFIASSVEGLATAYAVQTNLEHDMHGTVWPQGVFGLSESPLDALLEALDRSDFGIFIFSPDDIVKMRDGEHTTVRDNVLFELGLFIGKLGKRRCFVVTPDTPRMKFPSDLVGVTPATFNGDRNDLSAALGPACHKIREAMQKHGGYEQKKSEESISVNYDDGDKTALLDSFLENGNDGNPHKFTDIDNELGLEPGTSKKYLPAIIEGKKYYSIINQGSNIIRYQYSPSFY